MSLKQIVVSKAIDTINSSSVLRLTSGIAVGTNDFTTQLSFSNSFFAGYPVFASAGLTSGPYAGQGRVVLAVAVNRWEIYLSDMTNLNTRVVNFYHGESSVFNPLMTSWRPLSASGIEPLPKLEIIAPTEELSINVVRSSKYSEVYESPLEQQVFAMVSDQGSGDSNQTNVISMINSWSPNFVVTAGDNIYTLTSSTTSQNAEIQFNNIVYTPFQNFITTGSFFPAIGNHDVDLGTPPFNNITGDGNIDSFAANWFRGKFPDVFKNNKNYYRVRPYNGYTEFFVLSSGYATTGDVTNSKFFFEPDGNTIGSVQYEWLSRALKDSDALYKIVVLHHPPYTNEVNYTPGISAVRWDFGAMGASAVLSGHAHNYERFLNQDIPYLVIGHGGATLRNYIKSASDSVSIIDNPPRFGALRCVADSRSLLIENRVYSGLGSGTIQDSFRIYPNSAKWTRNNTYTLTNDKTQTGSALSINVWDKAKKFNDLGQLLPSGIVECRIPTVPANDTIILHQLSLGKIGNPPNLVVEFVPLKDVYDNGGSMQTLRWQIANGIFPPALTRVDTLYHNQPVGDIPSYLRFYITSSLQGAKASRMSGYSSPSDTDDHLYTGYNLNRLNYTGYNFSYNNTSRLAGHYGPYKAGVLGCTNARVSLITMSIQNSFDNGTNVYLFLRNSSSTAWVPTSSNEEAWGMLYWKP